ncbi:MAG: thiamine pyrophosphate-dependent dehydrogenase E1 component subunit alpha [Opitutae bacterium]|nr:thiamine pyrophosphate-dependent dehydrogenase E1 component subunit alpha [Opitutae bacterium]
MIPLICRRCSIGTSRCGRFGSSRRTPSAAIATYRGHGHAIAKGLDPKAMMAELLCKESGTCGGRGGSMHLCDVRKDFLGTNAVVAAHIPIAGGVALANKLKRNQRVVVVFFGDGASCEGAFFETLNMAALWKIPLVFVCENNGFAISVRTEWAIPVANIAQRADGFGLPGVTVEGQDPVAVYLAMGAAVARARRGGGPTLVECKTTRWERHSAISAGKYENEEEAMQWKRNDPIPRFEKTLREQGVTEAQLESGRQRAKQRTDEALAFAIKSEPPGPETVGDFVFA